MGSFRWQGDLKRFKEGRSVRATELTGKTPIVGQALERWIYCGGTKITQEGKRHKKLETIQLWYCRICDRVFTPDH
jgi:hypothetical protein